MIVGALSWMGEWTGDTWVAGASAENGGIFYLLIRVSQVLH